MTDLLGSEIRSRGRRNFLRAVAVLGFAQAGFDGLIAEARDVLPNPIGYAMIAWPQREFAHGLDVVSRLGFRGVQMLGWVREAYAGGKTQELKQKLTDLRLKPVALSCSAARLAPGIQGNETVEVRGYAEFFSHLGGTFLQVTDGGDPTREYSAEDIRTLGARMNAVGKMAQDFGLTLGYHPHFGTIGETRQGLGRVLDATDPRYVKLIADVAHMVLGGSDPAEVIRTYGQRLCFLHLKDTRKEVAAVARQDRNRVEAMGPPFCEIGLGVVNYDAVVQALRAVRFSGWGIVELDTGNSTLGGPDAAAVANRDALRKLGFNV
ncbi:MAG TPA: sugar phosphate isomerase/epimerase [Terriglobales bacterium]|nr:sugar phosphate isomerase/epimerase [Terriglobales bacterium]